MTAARERRRRARDRAHATPLARRRLRQRAFRFAPADRAPVVLRHSRIYILPTRRGYALIATLIVMLLTSLNYALSLGLGVTFLLGGLVAAALLHTFRNLAGIEIKPLAASDTFAGGPSSFSLSLVGGRGARRDRRSIAATRGSRATCGGVRRARADGHARRADARRADACRSAASRSRRSHPLGLWRGWAYVHFPLAGIVVSGARAARAAAADRRATASTPRAAGRSGDADLAGLREYQRGDPLQRVAWKAVARGAGWFSKAFEGSGGGGPVALDWSRAAAASRHRGAALAAGRLGAGRGARDASVRAVAARDAASAGRHRVASIGARR